jgi:hypothetical protein
LRPNAGQEVRLLNVPATASARFGVYQKVYGARTIREFSVRLRAAATSYCGTAGPAFLEALVKARAKDPARLADWLQEGRARFLAKTASGKVDEQVRSAAARFALIGLAGELARTYGVVPWPEGAALRAAEHSLDDWKAARGGNKAAEDMQAVEVLKTFTARYGASRFEHLPLPKVDEHPERVVDRAGYVRTVDGRQEFLILAPIWKNEIFAGMDAGRAARALAEIGLLKAEPGGRHFAKLERIPGRGPARVYVISDAILEGTEE